MSFIKIIHMNSVYNEVIIFSVYETGYYLISQLASNNLFEMKL